MKQAAGCCNRPLLYDWENDFIVVGWEQANELHLDTNDYL